ncbi:PREDICTED: uncharacterized protein At2g33490-like isoform X2 [Nelumbo nucifera]|uniref:Uncharacterized protein At2g33490-like isoform X2 n=2 Tax=Nelumbo nucifera TaxID=4432 RepID=A0A1U7ZD12_NELNU|nr:PREDICTED: uncharacterized protein At2g33490-like isoform X2 [Nelumbo nucifera]DAD30467.1 TPA_asm: hypothetical protein HUJ06_009318 [Nelumbo nucifera]
MKSSLRKLRGFALNKNDARGKRDNQPSAQLDELAQASQDMQDMRNCYDSLLSAAAATANSAYEFSESLREMGTCLLQRTALNDDEDSGRVLLMLGKVQFELQKLVDSYRSHIFQTITTPSESLLNELRTVEDMKRQCDEKRNMYEYILAAQREKGRPRSSKGSFSSQQLKAAHDEYDEEATFFVFRLKSLKKGQSRSLLTQAARHHAAQLKFFRKALKSLEDVEAHVKLIAEQQHIDYEFSGLEDDDCDDDDDSNDDGELSFDYGDVVATASDSMELDQVDLSLPQVPSVEVAQENLDKSQRGLYAFSREPKAGSQSAPILAEKKFDPAERIREMQSSATRKFRTYVLPTPVDAKGPVHARSGNLVPQTRQTNLAGRVHNLWHSSPLEPKKYEKDSGDKLSRFASLKAQSVLKESNTNSAPIRLSPPLGEGLSLLQLDLHNASDAKKIKTEAFSAPLTSRPWSTKPPLSASGPNMSIKQVQLISGILSRAPVVQPSSSPKVSPSASPPLIFTPKISELHELPRPPVSSTTKPTRPSGLIGHSGPLIARSQAKQPLMAPNAASPLSTHPLTVSRSFSIPSGSQRERAFHVVKLLETPQNLEKAEEVVSPPLTPILLINIQPAPTVAEVTQASQIRVQVIID